jgi:aryl-alcohol dehydrogenase-like predicted oxidoreductase
MAYHFSRSNHRHEAWIYMEKQPQQERIPLKRADTSIPLVGVGTWQWGDWLTWGYGRSYKDGDLRAAFDASLAAGVDFFDTAEIYGRGRSEKLLGQFIRESGRKVVVATKFMPYPYVPTRWSKGSLRRCLEGSLKRLGLQSVDLYQMHWPFPPVSIETWMDAMADAYNAGLIRAVGVSNYNVSQMQRAYARLAQRKVPLATNQVLYSLMARGPERSGLLAACKQMGITLIAYSPLGMGLLTGKYTPQNPPPWGVMRARYRMRFGRVQPLLTVLREVAQGHGKTLSQTALNWVICKGAVPIPGAKNAKQVQENAGALGWRLSADEIARLDEASDQI